ncbi:hypothetical protein KMU_29400 [Proteus vulgaris]|uniref:hypothetical protein n=1 Tax=Proteus vulgaris TaxID=585 RepID=UPI00255439B1|nr:hypothetical protein [Proteus vulgaris]GLX64898.1 hypothetical protein KMU_29400 [Proteus vulgaris]
MINKIETMPSKLIPMGTFNGKKEKPSIEGLANSNNTYHKNNDKQKEEKKFSLNNANNYVYLGSTNMSLLNNMGVTLNDDGSLILIKGKTHDLFTGLYQKHFKGGFKYNVFNIETQNGNDMKFKELYVDPNGFLIGNRYNNIDNGSDLYKIKFNRVEREYSLNDVPLNTTGSNFIVEYEKYIVDDNLKPELSSINNIVESKENNILKINREGLDITIEVKDNQLFTSGLPAILESRYDQTDSAKTGYKIKLPLKNTDKILAIKPILNQIQLVVDKGNKIKIYYLDPLNIFAVKDYQYEVTRLKQEPPLSFYSMVGENNYKNYHSGQPFSTQTIGNFSSRNIPFFSSFIDNSRLHISKAKEQYALKKYKAMMKNIAKAVDPGFRGLFCNIKQLINSSTSAYNSKPMALYGIKENIGKSYDVLNRIVKGVKNGVTQGDVIYSLVKDLKEKENITINHHSDIRAFFGINAFQLPSNIGVNVFLLASYAKSHSITLSKSEDNKITFSFINNNKSLFVAGLSAGIGGYEKRWDLEDVNYGFVTPIMASALLSATYAKESNFSFSLDINEISKFINQGLSQNENELINNSTLEIDHDISLSLGTEVRSEASFDVDVMINPNMELTVPRNAIGINFILNLLKLNLNINKFIDYGKTDVTKKTKMLDLNLLELGVDIYRDLKFTPSTSNSDNVIQWYPLTSVKDFELMVKKRINSLLSFTLFKSEKLISVEKLEQDKKNIKGIYKRVLKLNKLLESFPEKYYLSNNIDKLDSVYLNLSSDKKPINKLKNDSNKKPITVLSQSKDEVLQAQITEENRKHNINHFLSSLKERKETLSSQTKDNMNEKFKPYFTANYQLNRQGRSLRSDLQNEINKFVEESKNSEQIDLNKIKEKLDDLYTKYKQQFAHVEYQIASTDLMSVSELSYKKKTLPTGFVRLGNKKAIIHTQVKGNINYIYNEGEERVDKISTSYYY